MATGIGLGTRESPGPNPAGPARLARYLQRLNRQDLRYAVTVRGHQGNGDYFDIHFIRTLVITWFIFRNFEYPDRCRAQCQATKRPQTSPVPRPTLSPEEILRRKPSEILKELDRIRQRRRQTMISHKRACLDSSIQC